jgi:hypothetical protein
MQHNSRILVVKINRHSLSIDQVSDHFMMPGRYEVLRHGVLTNSLVRAPELCVYDTVFPICLGADVRASFIKINTNKKEGDEMTMDVCSGQLRILNQWRVKRILTEEGSLSI